MQHKLPVDMPAECVICGILQIPDTLSTSHNEADAKLLQEKDEKVKSLKQELKEMVQSLKQR